MKINGNDIPPGHPIGHAGASPAIAPPYGRAASAWRVRPFLEAGERILVGADGILRARRAD